MSGVGAAEGFSIGNVLGAGFRIWFRKLPAFFLITAVVYLPIIIWGASIVHGDATFEQRQDALELWSDAGMFLIPLLNILGSAALVYGVVMELSGEPTSFVRCIAVGLARFFPALGVTLLTVIAVFGGMLVFLVPGVIAMCVLYVSTPAAVLEPRGVRGALGRSAQLTHGHRWEILGIIFLLAMISAGVGAIIYVVFSNNVPLSIGAYESQARLAMYVDLARAILIGSLSSVMTSVAYFYLRREKDGTTAGELSRVFE